MNPKFFFTANKIVRSKAKPSRLSQNSLGVKFGLSSRESIINALTRRKPFAAKLVRVAGAKALSKPSIVALSIYVSLAGPCAALATTAGTIGVNPFSQVVTIQPGQSKATINLGLSNSSAIDRTFEVSAVDFGSLNNTGGLIFNGENGVELQKKYGLTKWMEIPDPVVKVQAGKTIAIPVIILNQDDLTPGGHYGAVIFREQADPVTGQVSLHSAISSLLFVQKIGGEKYGLKLSSLSRDKDWWQSLSLQLKFQNSGNIDVVPRGVVRLLNPHGQEVARAAINEDSGRILPETSRQFVLALTNSNKPSAPGKYQLIVQYRYDGQNNFTTYKTTFYYIPIGSVILLLGILVVVLSVFGVGVVVQSKGKKYWRKKI